MPISRTTTSNNRGLTHPKVEKQGLAQEPASVSRCKVPQVRERGRPAFLRVCRLADDKGGMVPCNGLRGFTLVELSMVLFIIALAVTLTLPLLGKVGDADLHAAGRRLAGTIKYLYNEAVLEKTTYRLVFDLDHASYSAERRDDSGEWTKLPGRMGTTKLPDSVEIKRIAINGRGSFTTGEIKIQIYPAGWLDEAALYLQDGKYKQTLRISALTGTTEFYDGFRDFF
jgi:prepilin-type N-terminal cleavage/methylation domain-containing protein